MELQQRTIEWTEEFLDANNKIQKKQTSLGNLQSSIVLTKSELLEFYLRVPERVKEVCKNEHTHICTIAKNSKLEMINLFRKFITKVADWETPS